MKIHFTTIRISLKFPNKRSKNNKFLMKGTYFRLIASYAIYKEPILEIISDFQGGLHSTMELSNKYI